MVMILEGGGGGVAEGRGGGVAEEGVGGWRKKRNMTLLLT